MRHLGVVVILLASRASCLSLSSSSGDSASYRSNQPESSPAAAQKEQAVEAAQDRPAPVPVVAHYKTAEHGYSIESPLYQRQEEKRMSAEKEAKAGTHSAATLSYAQCLIGFIVFVMALFYLVNSPDLSVRFYTWMKINVTMSVFLSLVIYRVLQEIFLDLASWMEIYVNKPLWGVVFFSILLVVLQVTTHQLRNYKKSRTMLAVSTIGAHLVAFSALYGFAALQATAPFNSSALMSTLVGIIAGLVFLFVAAISGVVRKNFAEDDGEIDKNEQQWMDEAEAAENDAMSIAIGFLTMQSVRFAICGSLQPYGALQTPVGITQYQTNILLLVSFIFFFLTGTWTLVMVQIRWMLPQALKRLCMLLQNAFVMTWAYCLLFWGEWQVYLWGITAERIAMCMLVALVLTTFSILHIIFINAIHHCLPDGMGGHRALWSLVLAFGVLVGFAWERVFDIAMDSFEEDMTFNALFNANLAHWVTKRALPILLVALLLPAWWLYIIVRHHEHREQHDAIDSHKESGMPPKTYMPHGPVMGSFQQHRPLQQHYGGGTLGGGPAMVQHPAATHAHPGGYQAASAPPGTLLQHPGPAIQQPGYYSAPPEHYQLNAQPAPGYGSMGPAFGGYDTRAPPQQRRVSAISSSMQPVD